MTMRPHPLTCWRLLLTSALLTLCGCTTVISPPKNTFAAYNSREKIHFKLALNIPDDLHQYQWVQKDDMGSDTIMPAGQAVATNLPVLARQVFTDVVDLHNGIPPAQPVDATLTPKLVNSGYTIGGTSFSHAGVYLMVEWTLVDPTNHVIWADTITGVGSGSTGWSSPEGRFKQALEDLLKKSERQLWSAQAIRRYAQTKYPEVKLIDPPTFIHDPRIRDLCFQLQATNPDDVVRALKFLRKTNSPEAIPAVQTCLESNNSDIVREAGRTLIYLGYQH